jgi:uncharacterized BrkB/YihY/UPF0761 family membrane protein
MKQNRGHDAEAPWQIPAHGWTDILRRAWKNAGEKDLSLVAGGVTYYLLVALFPTLVALVSLYCLVANPADVTRNTQRHKTGACRGRRRRHPPRWSRRLL